MILLSHLFFPSRMRSGWVSWMVVLQVSVIRLDSSMTQGRDSPEDFVIQAKADCYFTNGTEKVQFVVRFIFNLEEYARFDSDVGMFVALTELGKPDAELWNNRPDILERSKASVDTLCRHNYKLGAPFTVGRKGEVEVQPEVAVYPERTPSLQHHNLLLCSVTGAQSAYSWRKMLSGIAGFLLGLIFLLVGTVICLRAQKGYVETQLSGDEVSRAVPSP
ncbi:HLA class II histocompatibility antigen, DO beta chain-like isoform X4 [Herpailurus yagouaroundi]|uniref:HLA class II histocompatibility antigen, DO beta chain-like isoform X4 n=1 Tax=Herpailurus yagouaroundi TaxID=1608482 RepID=UPI001AD69F50|nr:HLA class II histocompatibility antigen, DO beta chain-like isoform X4 [Puma yagouaroundi]